MDSILSANVLVFSDNNVLLVRHGEGAGHLTGVYGLPGGRPNSGETLEDAAIRELLEETGIRVNKEDLVSFPNNQYSAKIRRKDGTNKLYTMTVYVSNKFTGELVGSDETIPEWIEIPKLNSYHLLPNAEKAINDSLKFLRNE